MEKVQELTELERIYSLFSWQDISLSLWAFIMLCSYWIGKFLRWFSIREVKNYSEKQEQKIIGKISELIDEKVKVIQERFHCEHDELRSDLKEIKILVERDIKHVKANERAKDSGLREAVLLLIDEFKNEKR
jgi:hypothetical protein